MSVKIELVRRPLLDGPDRRHFRLTWSEGVHMDMDIPASLSVLSCVLLLRHALAGWKVRLEETEARKHEGESA